MSSLACWLFLVSVAAHFSSASRGSLDFSMAWYSFVFPNTGLLTATFGVADAVGSPAIGWVGSILTVILIAVWLFVTVMMVRAVWNRQILWPQKQEDRDEGGWKYDEREKAYMEYRKAKIEEQQQQQQDGRQRGGSLMKRVLSWNVNGQGQGQGQGQDGHVGGRERGREREREGSLREERESSDGDGNGHEEGRSGQGQGQKLKGADSTTNKAGVNGSAVESHED